MLKGTLIFDLDGTLLESSYHICGAVRKTLREAGLAEASDTEILAHLGETSAVFCRSLAPDYPDPEEFRARFRANERRALSRDSRLYPGVKPLLERLLGEGFSLAICSNASEEYIGLALEATGITRLFSSIVSASEHPLQGAGGAGDAASIVIRALQC